MTPPSVLFLGRTTLDALYWLDQLPSEDTKAYARHFRAAPGGPALNAALTHAKLGGRALLVSAVGGGPWATEVRAQLNRHQIQLLDLADGTDYETPLTTVLIDGAHSTRTIVNPPLSTLALPPMADSWQQAVPAAWGAVPPVILTDGFHLAQTLPLLSTLKETAICLDGGSWKPGTAELVPLLTVAICSERFRIPGQPSNPEATIAWFATRGVPYIAVTRGPRSILGWKHGRIFEIEIEPIEAVDTLGAGDVLHGAFCHHFAIRPDFEWALRQAAQIATQSCLSLGIASEIACGIPDVESDPILR
jgi:sugar/nucleoside kinase (ribokinase family)